MRTAIPTLLIALLLAAAGGQAARQQARADAPVTVDSLRRLDERHDFFALRLGLLRVPDAGAPEIRFYRAAVDAAFNQLRSSNDILQALLAMPRLDPFLRYRALDLERRNDIRAGRYRAAAGVALRELAIHGVADPATIARLRDTLRLLQALADVPPQTADIREDTTLRFETGATGPPCVPVGVNGRARCFTLAPGSPESTITESEAKALGLPIGQVAVPADSSGGRPATTGVAVVDRLTIGHILYRHVVFLVVPEAGPEGEARRPGSLGLPVIEAMGELEIRGGQTLHVPRTPPPRQPYTLAIDHGDLLTWLGYGGSRFVCRFDPDAARTVFYEPFFRRFRAGIVRAGEAHISEVAGIDGPQPVPGFRLPALAITLAGMPVTIAPADIFAALVSDPRHNYLYCDVGRDALGPFGAYTIDFRSMSLVLEK